MSTNSKSTAIALGATLAGSLALTGSAFAMHSLAQGYMVSGHEAASAHDHAKAMKAAEKPHGMATMDTDKDGKLSKAEFAAAHDGSDAKFAAHDPDGDGFITTAEMDAHHAAGANEKCKEGKCGEGKCGAGKAEASKNGDAKGTEGKCGEGKCGEGKCGAGKSEAGKAGEAKGTEGKCGEGKCGEGKCGGSA